MTPRCKPNSCEGCSCYSHGTDFSQVEGQGSLGVMIVAEASGEHEQRDGLPLRPYAPAGSVIERAIRRLGYGREQFTLTNVLRCRPKNNLLEGLPWEHSAISQCRPNLLAAIKKHQPRVILALGNIPLRELTGHTGKARTVSHLRGYAHAPVSADLGDRIIFSTYHPAHIRRGAVELTGVFMRDIQRAVLIAQGRDKSYQLNAFEKFVSGQPTGLRYSTHPSLDEAEAYYTYISSNTQLHLSYDMETVETLDLDEDAREQFTDTVIRTFQFSHERGQAICIPYEGAYKRIISKIMMTENEKSGQNVWLFDDKVMRAVEDREGIKLVPRKQSHDTLQMFHHWQPDLPAHLQYAASFVQFPFAWKHLSGTNVEFYGCCDADATGRLFHEGKRTMQQRGIWDGYVNSVYYVRPVLAEVERRGLPIDDQVRQGLDQEFAKAQEELLQELDGRFPDSCRRGKQKDGYKKLPKQLAEWAKGKEELIAVGTVAKLSEDEWYQMRKFADAQLDAEGNPTTVPAFRWVKLEPFKPNSGPQLVEYMKAKKHPVPKDMKKAAKQAAEGKEGDGENTQKKELQRLAAKTGDDLYLKVIECREFGKMRGTYIEGFKPLADGRVHATITFDTATWQLAAKSPNIMNFPKHGRLAKVIRRMVAAPPGRKIVEFDFKAFHVLTTGYFAESEQYMRMARLDMHSFVAGHFAKCWDAEKLFTEPDQELREKFKWFKSDEKRKVIRDKKAKPSILGIGFGLGVNKLFDMNRESFQSLAEAKALREIIQHLFPEVFAWQERIKKLAHEQTYLKSPHGGIRWFYDVFQWSSKMRKWIGGEQAEQAIAFLPANAAFGHIRECLKELERLGYAERYELVNNIHDAVSNVPEDKLVEECLVNCHAVLTAPSKVLVNQKVAPGGLAVDVDASVGQHWAAMEDVKIPVKAMEATV